MLLVLIDFAYITGLHHFLELSVELKAELQLSCLTLFRACGDLQLHFAVIFLATFCLSTLSYQ